MSKCFTAFCQAVFAKISYGLFERKKIELWLRWFSAVLHLNDVGLRQ